MLEHFRQNLGYRLLAIFLAIIFWMYVTGEQNPTGQTIVRVPLETVNLREGLVIADRPTEVQVRVEGRKADINNLLARDVYAYADLRNATVGINTIPVSARIVDGLNVNIVHVNPSEVNIRVEKIEQKQLPVTVTVIGDPAVGYKAMEPVIKPSQILVSGPANILKKIQRVYVKAKIDQATSNYIAQLPITFSNREEDKAHQWLTVNPDTVEVFIPVVQDMPSKVLPVRPNLVGQPAKGFRINRITLQPQVVSVFAPYEKLADLDYINSGPINIDGAKKNVIVDTNLEIPMGVQMSNFPRARVVIEIVPE
ncbi:MAG: hypothetical protein PWP31_1847 [Clostridia bacterium]|nr:hypothetical protein [Clostridia bacterium]MDK2901371.1 hypothetical protein [Thermosediminibacterales bacterium]